MIKAAGFTGASIVAQPAYNSSPITRGAMFTAVKPAPGQAAEPLTEEEMALAAGKGCLLPEPRPQLPEGYLAKLSIRFIAYIILLGVLLFGSAGRVDWIHAWVYLGLSIVITMANAALFISRCPDLILERMASVGRDDIKPWDKIIMPLVAGVGPVAILLVAGLETRFSWPPAVPGWASALAYLVFLAGYAWVTWAMLSNRFFSAVVRIQKERGHKVVDSGPYAIVRHPGYAGGVLVLLAMPLALGSAWGLLPAVITLGLYVIRTALEDATLAEELDGYKDYQKKVKYRLIPGVW